MYLHLSFICLLSYGHFDDSISLLLKEFIGFSYPLQRKTVGDERCGVNLSLLDELQDLFTVTAIHTSCLESEVLAVHLRQRQHLRLIIKGYNGYDSIRTSTLPSELECVVCSSNFKNSVRTAMIAVLDNELMALFGSSQKN